MENMVETSEEDLVVPQDSDLFEFHISDLIGWLCCVPNLCPLKRHKLLSILTVIYSDILSKVSSIKLSAFIYLFIFYSY